MAAPAAYAIMHRQSFEALGIAPHKLGAGDYHAAGVCAVCFVTPAQRKRVLKAHYASPGCVLTMLSWAGSSSSISM